MLSLHIGNCLGSFIVKTITLTSPDDWHVHFRDGEILKDTVNATSQHFARALIMPNLRPALTSVEDLLDYRDRILHALLPHHKFQPFMTLYLNETVTPDTLHACKRYPFIVGGKLYPAGATTNSEEGVASLKKMYPLFEEMQAQGLVLQIHGETTCGDIFDREQNFIEQSLRPILANFPKLRIVLEHISTAHAVRFVENGSPNLAASITPHHLFFNRNDLLAGGIRPHYYCLPILKRSSDQDALIQAAVSGNPRFFAGTDSAPHTQESKESNCGCAGIYSAPYALAMYAQVFDDHNHLSALNNFVSQFGADFYQVPYNTSSINLINKAQMIPASLPLAHQRVVPIAAGQQLSWSIDA